MSSANVPPQRVPTLTEVVAWPETAAGGAVSPTVAGEAGLLESDLMALPTAPALQSSEDQLTQRIHAELQRQVDLMIEYRLREALTPLLARAADSIVREARSELASTLRDVVARAVAQELARHRSR